MRHGIVWTTTIVCAALGLNACNRQPDVIEVQRQADIPRKAEPVLLTGCLKRGLLADSTFVLLVAQKDSSGGTATYELIAAPGVNLSGQVDQQVEVTGTLQAERIALGEDAARVRAAKGTSGTPIVETKTDLDVRRVDATSLRPIGAACKP
jgi:hypothetical protein